MVGGADRLWVDSMPPSYEQWLVPTVFARSPSMSPHDRWVVATPIVVSATLIRL